MIPLFTAQEFDNANSNDLLSCKCSICNKVFQKQKRAIVKVLDNKDNNTGKYCSRKCIGNSQMNKHKVVCKNCNTEFEKTPSQVKKFPNHFCSRSCAVTYNNTHKTTGTRRSKLEVWLEEQLVILYPTFSFDFNKKEAINYELDIYIPSLKLAFELNGIFHYEPIYGQNKLDQIQNNDQRKFAACAEKGISLCIIDTSMFKHFKPLKAQKFLDIIINVINQRTFKI